MGLPSPASSQLELAQAGNRLDHHLSRSLGSPVRELTFLIPVISPFSVPGALTALRGYTATDGVLHPETSLSIVSSSSSP